MASAAFYSASLKSQVQYDSGLGKKKRTYTQSQMSSAADAEKYSGLALAAQDCRAEGIDLIGVKKVETDLITD